MSFLGPAPERQDVQHLKYLFTDIDDTLTTNGRLLPQTFQALWDLHDAGIAVIPVTGGSAGWCEHIVRTWPVAAAIAESGALALTVVQDRVHFDFWFDAAEQRDNQQQHQAAILQLLQRHPGFELAHDQPFRLADVAIDIIGHERSRIDALAADIRKTGATAAISSIHINTWLGAYNKRTMSERVLSALTGQTLADANGAVSFVGDSRNDASMFSAIRNSFGVRNLVPYLDDLPDRPRWISSEASGAGFATIARAILHGKQAPKGF